MNSYFSKKEFNEWVMLYILENIYNNSINEKPDPVWFAFIENLKSKNVDAFINMKKAQMSMRSKSYHKYPVKNVMESSKDIRILT